LIKKVTKKSSRFDAGYFLCCAVLSQIGGWQHHLVEYFGLDNMQGGGDELCWALYAEWVSLMILNETFSSYI
jgi:hypothetical protein